jgi:hypothetical protein
MFTAKTLKKMAPPGLTFGEHCAILTNLVPYSRNTAIKNKKLWNVF